MFKLAKTLLALALAATTLAMAGCSQSRDVVATVGSHTITSDSFDASVDEFIEYTKEPDRGKANQTVLGLMINGRVFREMAKEADMQPKEADRQKLLEQADPKALELEHVRELLLDKVDSQLIAAAYKSKDKEGDLLADALKVEVDLNPRYGAWSPETGLDPSGGSLSSLATAAPEK